MLRVQGEAFRDCVNSGLEAIKQQKAWRLALCDFRVRALMDGG